MVAVYFGEGSVVSFYTTVNQELQNCSVEQISSHAFCITAMYFFLRSECKLY